jgi:hypothetical protein
MEEKSCGQAARGKSKKAQHKTVAEHSLDDFIHGNLLKLRYYRAFPKTRLVLGKPLPKNINHQGRTARRTKEHEREVRLVRKRRLAPLRYLGLEKIL